MTKPDEEKGSHSDCAVCGRDFAFDLPQAIVDAADKGHLVIFAGAGISTESQEGFPRTFFDDIQGTVTSGDDLSSFPKLMSAYENEFGRPKLIEKIIERLRYAETFPSLRYSVTRFHRELSSISQIQEIITTNWDAFFEEECGALPIVVDGDFIFHNIRGRKVYKIHGSIRNVSTIIATEADYKRTQSKLKQSAVGGTLRHLLASKVVVYIGFSLKDSDFLNVYQPLMRSMGNMRPVAYFVTPFDNEGANKLGLHHLRTSGTEFMRSLKAHLIEDESLIPDSVLDDVLDVGEEVREARELTLEMNWRDNPEIVFSIAYQDGMIHALERIGSQRVTGEYNDSARVQRLIHDYSRLLHRAIEKKRIWDAAYVNGYLSILFLLHLKYPSRVKVKR